MKKDEAIGDFERLLQKYVSKLESKIEKGNEKLEKKVGDVSDTNKHIQSRIETISHRVDDIYNSVGALPSRVKVLEDKIQDYTKFKNKIEKMILEGNLMNIEKKYGTKDSEKDYERSYG